MISRLNLVFKSQGIVGILRAISRRVVVPRVSNFRAYDHFFKGKTGLEIGGPSAFFRRNGAFPVYPIAGQIDNCNFNDQTTWEGSIDKGLTFHYDKRRAPGNQYIGEAAELSFSASSAYDFVLSCHVLEHVANPLQAIYECKRVIKENGVLVIVVPNKACTFDHRRPVTTMAHLVQDFEQNVTEADLTHLEEILRLHDLARDPGGGNFHAFKERSERNAENRCLHHHVFDRQLAIKIVDWIGLQIVVVETLWPYHILVVAQKYEQGQQAGNKVFFNGPREGTFGRMT